MEAKKCNDIINLVSKINEIDTSEIITNFNKISSALDGDLSEVAENEMKKISQEFENLSKNFFKLVDFIDRKIINMDK